MHFVYFDILNNTHVPIHQVPIKAFRVQYLYFFSLKFWLGFHGVANGLNNLYGGIKMPNSDTVINVGPGSVDKLMFRVPGFQTVRTWFPTIYQKIKNYEYFTMLDKFRFPKSIQKFTGREYMPGLNKIAGRVAGPEILTVTNYSN